MKGLFALLLFSSFSSLAQIDSLDYTWPKPGVFPGFYATYSNFDAGKLTHHGPFIVKHGMMDCWAHRPCHGSDVNLTSKVKSEIFPLDIKYLSDGTDLFVVYKTTPGGFGTHIEINMIQNKGRYGFFERIEPNQQIGLKPHTKYFIIDLKTNTIYKASKKNLAIVFKDAMDLLTAYKNEDDELELIHYVIQLNRKLGYLKKTGE
jgi:hypothetical protein